MPPLNFANKCWRYLTRCFSQLFDLQTAKKLKLSGVLKKKLS